MPSKSLIEDFLDAGAGLLDELFGEEDASAVAAHSRNAAMSGAFEGWCGACPNESGDCRRTVCERWEKM
jgi:hypothetical protein